ncbi:MAG TPA: glycosyltransferase family 2 protein [Candidatus Acidoferrales bacterium]|nr:glycosyltransferase family 2 protein [Candidatus Acidoferrales bacterium]
MISVVIPAYNEAGAIAATVAEIAQVLASAGFAKPEIIVVDDGSTDTTGQLAGKRGARVVKHPHNVGYGRSLKDGIAAARNETIVISDADGTYPITKIPLLVGEFAKGFDMVIGAREGRVYEGRLKWPLRLILKWMVEFTTGRQVPDVNSGLRVFGRSTVMTYFPHLSDGFSFSTSLTLAYMLTGRFVEHVPIGYNQRVGGTKVRLFRDTLRTLQYIVEAIVYYNPIKIFILIDFICVGIGALAILIGAALRQPGPVWFGILMGVLAVLVFCIGLVAVLLKKTLDRPAGSGSST